MALYEDKLMGSQDLIPSVEDMEVLAMQKAQELFRLCDKEEKGFINKMDMQRLQSELSLTPDQLEAVFDSLDDDSNGFLTLEEFIEGFGSYLGLKSSAALTPLDDSNAENVYEAEDYETEDKIFQDMMNNVGANQLYDDEKTIKSLWSRLRKDDPDMAGNFEDFLFRISNEIRRSKVDFDTLENALRNKSSAHDEEVRKLYEEMELQIKQEKERILSEEQLKEQQFKEAMERELQEKDRQLQELLQKHQEMEDKLRRLNLAESETKLENEKLAKDKEDLEEMLIRSQEGLEESKLYINQLRNQQSDEKKERARAALKLTEGIALERESLVKQLHTLKDVNKKLRDDKDEADTRRVLEAEAIQRSSRRRGELSKQGSILGNYFPTHRSRHSTVDYSVDELDNLDVDDEDIEVYEEDLDNGDISAQVHALNVLNNEASVHSSQDSNNSNHHSNHSSTANHKFSSSNHENRPLTMQELEMTSSDCDTDGNQNHKEKRKIRKGKQKEASSLAVKTQDQRVSIDDRVVNGPRGQPVGADLEQCSGSSEIVPPPLQQRVFKVVFVGDSGVGKSSLIQRFCHDQFNPAYSATIGVDFQVKSLDLTDVQVVLQLWDTAGQERFRSITKQYFRKADGVIVMYDVTSEQSFLSVRNWIDSIKENVDDKTVLELIGNKIDLTEEDDDKRVVKKRDGQKLAQEYECIFYETSAKSGFNVTESMKALANLLKDKEDEEMEKALHLEEKTEKKSCCSR